MSTTREVWQAGLNSVAALSTAASFHGSNGPSVHVWGRNVFRTRTPSEFSRACQSQLLSLPVSLALLPFTSEIGACTYNTPTR
jgi:hypothetical protein